MTRQLLFVLLALALAGAAFGVACGDTLETLDDNDESDAGT
jgi:hypothetical protein